MLREYWPIAYASFGFLLLLMAIFATPYYVGFLFYTAGLVPLLVMAIGIISTVYVLSDKFRTTISRTTLLALGLSFLVLSSIVFITPTSFGLAPQNILVGDAVLLTLGGILLSIVTLEQPYKQTVLTISWRDTVPKFDLRKKLAHHRTLFELFAFKTRTEP